MNAEVGNINVNQHREIAERYIEGLNESLPVSDGSCQKTERSDVSKLSVKKGAR